MELYYKTTEVISYIRKELIFLPEPFLVDHDYFRMDQEVIFEQPLIGLRGD